MLYRLLAVCGLLGVVAGCGVGQSEIVGDPGWADFNGKTVTVRGTAGNSAQGAIVRLQDESFIPLKMREKWGIDAVGRPVVVTGKVVPGTGYRAEPFILEATHIDVPTPEETVRRKTVQGAP